jgi:hypothetical protein
MATKLNALAPSTMVAVRTAVSSDDSANPVAAQSVVDCDGCRDALVHVVLAGTDVGCRVTPLYWDATSGVYVEGDPVVVGNNTRFRLTVDGVRDLYFKVDAIVGSSSVISVLAGASAQ